MNRTQDPEGLQDYHKHVTCHGTHRLPSIRPVSFVFVEPLMGRGGWVTWLRMGAVLVCCVTGICGAVTVCTRLRARAVNVSCGCVEKGCDC